MFLGDGPSWGKKKGELGGIDEPGKDGINGLVGIEQAIEIYTVGTSAKVFYRLRSPNFRAL